jgi:hypothetical protein
LSSLDDDAIVDFVAAKVLSFSEPEQKLLFILNLNDTRSILLHSVSPASYFPFLLKPNSFKYHAAANQILAQEFYTSQPNQLVSGGN